MIRHPFIFLVLFAALAARADLTMEQQSKRPDKVITSILRLHDDKMRMDQHDEKGHGFIVIIDLKTRDSITLVPKYKMFLKRSGADIERQMQSVSTNQPAAGAMNRLPDPAVDSGKIETVNGHDAKIFTWSGANGLAETLWVATNYPDYEAIRTELARLDRFNHTGPHKNAQPDLAALPGMVVRTETKTRGPTIKVDLVSVSLKPVDAALFEMPANYIPWTNPPASDPSHYKLELSPP